MIDEDPVQLRYAIVSAGLPLNTGQPRIGYVMRQRRSDKVTESLPAAPTQRAVRDETAATQVRRPEEWTVPFPSKCRGNLGDVAKLVVVGR